MKTCPYCGKENSDDATVCVIDGQSLLPEAPSIPSKPSRAEVRAHLAARPLAVKVAIGLLVFGSALDLVRGILRSRSYPRYFAFYLPVIIAFSFLALLFFCVFRGKNLARWTVLFIVVVGTLATPFILIGPLRWDFYFYTLLNIVAVAALFQRSSNEWYKSPKKVSDQSLSTQFV